MSEELRARRQRLLGAVSLTCLTLTLTQAAGAADLVTKAPVAAAPGVEGWTFSLYGAWDFASAGTALSFDPSAPFLGGLPSLDAAGDGGTAGLSVRKGFAPGWDWALAAQATSLRGLSSTYSATDLPNLGSTDSTASSDFDFQVADFEVGYRPDWGKASGLRLLAGARLLHASSDLNYGYDASDKFGSYTGDFTHDNGYWALGPRIGAEATVPLNASPFALTGSASGSALFGFGGGQYDYRLTNGNGPTVTTGSFSTNTPSTVFNLEASAGVQYRASSTVTFEVGYQVQQWWNVVPTVSMANDSGGFIAGDSDLLLQGPYAKSRSCFPEPRAYAAPPALCTLVRRDGRAASA